MKCKAAADIMRPITLALIATSGNKPLTSMIYHLCRRIEYELYILLKGKEDTSNEVIDNR